MGIVELATVDNLDFADNIALLSHTCNQMQGKTTVLEGVEVSAAFSKHG